MVKISQVEVDEVISFLEHGLIPSRNSRSSRKYFVEKCQKFHFKNGSLFYKEEDGLVKEVIAYDNVEAVKSAILAQHALNHFGIIFYLLKALTKLGFWWKRDTTVYLENKSENL